ncbi:hypothetical protein Dsin_017253 [Dipteronia sinensis]|uniref:Reverse transcriptase domain-containing protein n=1 Tax=Dipteronia sinensis TaxID=43782 RepID=A0AAE0AFX0_9ROSI|nr:hypothetical protein Dsin_017253 [Dipteronia sinensis]
MRTYHKDIGCPRLSLKVDLMKAFDMVDWGFLLETLAAFHFPPRIITWIKACLTTPKFSISFNALVLKAALDDLSLLSGFLVNQAKSNIFTSGLSSPTNQQLINLFGYTVDSLPIQYLGIPIISTKVYLHDCSPLVDKVFSRLTFWLNRDLSYTGRLQFIVSVLSSLQVFLANYICLHIKILKNIEQKFRSFLRNRVEGDSKGVKLSWSDICLHKKDGGLGIKDLSSLNKALMIMHLWILMYGTNNLWPS